jgi:hypothetical protein
MRHLVWVVALLAVFGTDAAGKKKPYRPDDMAEPYLPDPAVVAERQRTRLKQVEKWVGSWTGKATWKGCTIAGAKKLRVDVSPELATDGSSLMDGLGAFTWGLAADQLVMLSEGIEITMIPGKKGGKFTLATGAGCVAKATLKRSTSNIPACDTLRAVATIQASCPSLDATTRDDELARVTAAWKGWSKLRGKKKKARAAICTREADALREQILSCAGPR